METSSPTDRAPGIVTQKHFAMLHKLNGHAHCVVGELLGIHVAYDPTKPDAERAIHYLDLIQQAAAGRLEGACRVTTERIAEVFSPESISSIIDKHCSAAQ